MKNIPDANVRSTANNVSLDIIPSNFSSVEFVQTMGTETTISLTVQNGIVISHKSGNKLVFRGKNNE